MNGKERCPILAFRGFQRRRIFYQKNDAHKAARITNAPDVSAGTGWQEKRIICELFDKDTRMFRGSSWWNGAIDRVFGGHPDGTIAMTRSAENVRLKNNRIVNGNDKMVLDHADVK